ncbi:DoxX family protein [Robbsia sp. Bb-Pol-6]|uniref:DoxX family protein n=1 Tax=Robbsia betulipollinis TaxID=2981849 RepID=A0ABT3ZHY0_9BURK|nr:DoxX family protein [Robbsia betulipollinis]MCY0386067.1 DoxX family protein [Robbsia betulipollinis]
MSASLSSPARFGPVSATLRPSRLGAGFVIVPTVPALVGAVSAAFTAPMLAPQAAGFMVVWFALSLACALLSHRCFVPGFLGGLLFLLGGWRIAGPLGLTWVSWPADVAAALYFLQFIDAAMTDRARGDRAWLSLAQWQLTFVRIYIAFDMIPHFTEKLFAGPVPFHEDALILAHYGMSPPEWFVLAGGLCELAVAVGLGLGILTRLAALGAAAYFLITSMIGHHFGRGFIWNLNGGGWEYPLLMLSLFLGFVITGGGRFSVDHLLAASGRVPRFVSRLGLERALLDARAAAAPDSREAARH